MSPDPYSGSYDFTNPQSLNRYGYVLNNPLSAVDPMGLDEQICDDGGNCETVTDEAWEEIQGGGPGAGISLANGTIFCGGSACGSYGWIPPPFNWPGLPSPGSGIPAGGAGGGGPSAAPNNGNQSSWQQKMRQASHYICGKSPGDRVAKSVLTGAGIGAVTGGFGGFVAGEVFGGEVTFGLTGIPGAYVGAHVGAAVGAMNGLTTGAVLAGICYAGFQYDN